MIPFSCAFLFPLCLAMACGPGVALMVACVGILIACLRFRVNRMAAVAVIAGSALFAARLPSLDPPWTATPAPRAAVVVVEGTVSAPCRGTRSGILVPIESGPWIAVPGASESSRTNRAPPGSRAWQAAGRGALFPPV